MYKTTDVQNNKNMKLKRFTELTSDLLKNDRFVDVLKSGANVCGQIIEYHKAPSWSSAARVAFTLASGIVENVTLSKWSDEYFPPPEWTTYSYSDVILRLLVPALESQSRLVYTTKSRDDDIIKKFQYGDYEFGVVFDNERPTKINVKVKDQKALVDIIPQIVQNHIKSETVVLQRTKHRDDDDAICVVDDPYENLHSSQLAVNVEKSLRRYMDAGIHRSLLMYGLAGTGKSTMARVIIRHLGFKALRIKVEDVGHLDVTYVKQIISILKPEAILIDDFDRSHEQRRLLELMECFNKTVKLVIATVNNRDMLDESIMRPGRFDELLEVNKLDEEVVKYVLGDIYDEQTFQLVKDWPIAFINEFVVRRRIMSNEEAHSSIRELTERINRLKNDSHTGENEYQAFLKLLKKDEGLTPTGVSGSGSRLKKKK